MSTAEQLIAINHMQVAANHAVPSGAMPFQEVLRVYGEDQITGVGSCIDQEKRKRKRLINPAIKPNFEPFNLVRVTGLEPARGFPLEPKSSASANSAISANK